MTARRGAVDPPTGGGAGAPTGGGAAGAVARPPRANRLDRVRPRRLDDSLLAASVPDSPPDAEGKRALFSASGAASSPPAFGSVTVECSACGERTVLAAGQALRAAVPSVHLPLLRRDYPSWMRCPACGLRTWVRLAIQL